LSIAVHKNPATLRISALIFAVVVTAYALAAWDRLAEPSAQLHFVDLAHSFMDGRLDTETPLRRSASPRPDDPTGLVDALKRVEKVGGWNDWARVRRLTLKEGDTYLGRFAYPGDRGERRHFFHTHDGYEIKIVVPDDLARTCGPDGRRLCDETTRYVSFPPFPAVAMIPLAAVFGYDVNDVLLTVLMGGFNAVLLFWFLQLLVARGHSRRSVRDNVWLTLGFALGTVAFFSSVRGEVWFTALVFGVGLNLGYMLAALDLRHPVIAGLLLGCALATRVPIAFCVAFFAWQLFFPGNRWRSDRWREILVKGAQFAVPVLAIGVLLMLFNAARFGDATEFGHSYLGGAASDRVRDHGMFDWVYLNRNMLSAFVAWPRFIPDWPYVQVSNHGISLLFTTPILALLLWPKEKPKLRIALWLAVAFAAVPGLFYQNTGWKQFGFRFALDYLPYLFALLAVESRPLTRRVKALIIFAILVNTFGAITFGRFPEFYYESLMPGAT
jgi:HAMP domain-containing protein